MAKMDTVSVNAYAKVNFTLDVVGRAGGYHLLDSLVCTVGLFDRVTARRADGVRVRMTGEGAASIAAGSNAERAARAFCAAFGGGADIVIGRAIPVGAGLGSSSADAAGVLRALAKLYGIPDMVCLKSLADSLGSDTGYLLTGGWARMTGRGEQISPLAGMPPLWLLLLLPEGGVSTPACFAAFDRMGEAYPPVTERAIALLRQGNAEGARLFGNALTRAACSLCAGTGNALAAARRLGADGAGMTGSGSAVYAAFFSEEACRAAQAAYAGRATAMCVRTVAQIV